MKTRLIIFLIIASGAVVLFFLTGRGTTGNVYYYTPSEYFADPALKNSRVRLKGNIEPGSSKKSSTGLDLWFNITDGKKTIPVFYHGAVPDTFQESLEVVVDGRMGPKGTFIGRKLIVKCPSKYESAPTGSSAAGPAFKN